jgi:ATPases of the AAA+ class|nr:ATP-binding protein [Methanoculleus marisnigri]
MTVHVDVSGFLLAELRKTITGYRKAVAEADNATANERARACATLCRQIAVSSPMMQQRYTAEAERWKGIASRSALVAQRRQSKTSGAPGHSNRSVKELAGDTEMSSLIARSSVRWEDIGGLDEVKRLVKETVAIAALKRPESIRPWKGILLLGPPGTGKTMIAAAAAGSLDATFFNVKTDRLLSKYFGESSKMISSLYAAAREQAPSIVFIDEFDALGASRSDTMSEATRRVLSSLLIELDGLQGKKDDRLLLTMAATNAPWDLDSAILSRFPRRIYVPLPDIDACRAIIEIHMRGLEVSGVDLVELGRQCVDRLYSGRDIQNVYQQAIWTMINDVNPEIHRLADLPFDELKERALITRPLCENDFAAAFGKIRSPLKVEDLERYVEWNAKHGDG